MKLFLYKVRLSLKKITGDSFYYLCENAHIHLVSSYLQVASKYLPILAEFSGLEWSWQLLYDKNNGMLYPPAQLLPYEQKYKRKDKKHMRDVWQT